MLKRVTDSTTGHYISTIALAALLAFGCGGPGDRVEITQVEPRSDHRSPIKVNATAADRFEPALQMTGFKMAAAVEPGDVGFHATTPEGWTELPPQQFRDINMKFGPNGEGECYVSILPGGGGGLLENANRWRDQMELPPYTKEEFDALTRYNVLDHPAVYVDFEGTFSNTMTGQVDLAGYRMMGLLMEYQGAGVFVKMVGPADLVLANEKQFEEFVGSLHSSAGHSHDDSHADHDHTMASDAPPVAAGPTMDANQDLPEGHPPVDDAMALRMAQDAAGAESGSQGLKWIAPEHWVKAPDRTMRVVTYNIEGNDELECYISVLGGQAGGMAANINRWIGQFGGEALSDEAIDALPKVTIMEKEVPLIEAEGDFRTMRGDVMTDQALLGAAWISDDVSVFIKLTGPKEIVAEQKDAFIAFCNSLERVEEQ